MGFRVSLDIYILGIPASMRSRDTILDLQTRTKQTLINFSLAIIIQKKLIFDFRDFNIFQASGSLDY